MTDDLHRTIKDTLSARRPAPSRDLASRLAAAAAHRRGRPRFVVPAVLALSVAALALVVLATRPSDTEDVVMPVVQPAGGGSAAQPAGPALDPDRLAAYQALLDNPSTRSLSTAQHDKMRDAALELARQRAAHLERKRVAELELRKVLVVAEPDPTKVAAAFDQVAAEDTALARAELIARLTARAALDPAQRAEIERGTSTAPTPPLATLEIHSINAGRVEIDGKTVGTTPVRVQVTAGKHVVRVDYAGHESATRTVEIGAGSDIVIDVEAGAQLHANTGTLYVMSSPYATVTIDGKDVGETPLKAALSAGKHKIVIAGSDGSKQTRVVTIEPGKTTKIDTDLGKDPFDNRR